MTTGDVVKSDSPEADKSSSGNATPSTIGAGQSAAQKIAGDHKTEQDNTSSAAKTDEDALVEGVQNTSIANGDAEVDVPAIETKPGEPVGDVVFDHPPSDVEVKQALKAAA